MTDLIVVALESEVPELIHKYSNIHTIGVGKVNSAINLLKLIHQYNPTRIINLGTAGGITVSHGIHRINKVWQHDVNLIALGLQPGEQLHDRVNIFIDIPGPGLVCASGDMFITEPEKLRLPCDIVDMESYSVARVAKTQGLDVEIWKYISDSANESAGSDWQESVHTGEEYYIDVLQQLSAQLENK